MVDLRVTPAGNLRLETSGNAPDASFPSRLQEVFETDVREGLFLLAADRVDTAGLPTVRFWQGIAESLLAGLCHLPEGTPPTEVVPPSEAERAEWVLTAPPMAGGEYLSADLLLRTWSTLRDWCIEAGEASGGLQAFLEKRAPKWHQVGRVCFHLAENKADPARPFVFMATYVSGLAASGQPRHLPLGKALEQYAGAKNRPALINLLAPVQAASDRCGWVKALVESGGIYRPSAWTPERAYQFLLSVPTLEESGLTVRVPDWWRRRTRPKVSVTIGEKKPSLLGLDAILDFDVAVALGGAKLSRQEIEDLLAGGDGLVLFKGQWIEVDREKLREAITHWESLRDEARDGGVSFIEGMRMLAGASPDLKDESKLQDERDWVHVDSGDALREILAGLRDPARLAAPQDGGLKATLRPYQQNGAGWLQFLTELGLGACLADDMGLGKTIQVLALLLQLRKSGSGPSLLVVPASLLGNWRSEANRFAPELRLAFLHPSV